MQNSKNENVFDEVDLLKTIYNEKSYQNLKLGSVVKHLICHEH
jgi:hypothetical protein